MKRSIRTAVCALAAAGLALTLGACSEAEKKAVDAVDKAVNEKYEVTYEVSGKSVDEIEFAAGAGSAANPKLEKAAKPELPWKKTVTLRGIMPPTVVPISTDPTGSDLTCKVIYKGEVIKEASGENVVAGCIAVSPMGK
ncbi:MmpS family transport accessory protein [Streptomyces spectabilis]|uniref:MmpS family transport accessory protein n=2 Tax=Streptomyces spectabilis TaxID=68270 RepID=UPI0033D43A6C